MIAMLAALTAAVAGAGQAAQAPAARWTWTLFENPGSVALAHEIPDTDRLREVMECAPGSGAAKLTFYGLEGRAPAFLRLSAGGSEAAAEATGGGTPTRVSATLRTDHPVFRAFVSGGALTVVSDVTQRELTVPRAHLAKLQRFDQLCSG